MNSLSLLVLISIALVAVNCQMDDSEQGVQKRGESAQKYCGARLVDRLSLVCKGAFAGWHKRDYQYDDNMLVDDLYNYDTEDDSKWPFLSHLSSSNSLMPRYDNHVLRFKRQGIIKECCERSCTIRQLRQYCQ